MKQIAVLMGAAIVHSQERILKGMIEEAKKADCNLFIFTSLLLFKEKDANTYGEYQIMNLPDFRQFDGAVIVRNTIPHEETVNKVISSLKESGIPAVSIDFGIEGMTYIGGLNYQMQYDLVEHMIEVHGCRHMCYISGPSFNAAAMERRRAFEDALQQHGIEYSEEQIMEGMFDSESGKAAAAGYLKHHRCPEAFLCGNDLTAMGAVQALQGAGFRVPEDVYVTGIDNDALFGMCTPSLTSADRNPYLFGREAVKVILGHKKGEEPKRIVIPPSLSLRQSCGCCMEHDTDVMQIFEDYVKDKLHAQKMAAIMKSMMRDFSEMDSPDGLLESVKKYLMWFGIGEFYLCLCEREKLFGIPQEDFNGSKYVENINMDYTETMTMPIAYRDGAFQDHGPFYKGLVLPEEYRNRSGGNFYIVNALYYQRLCYGYCVCANSNYPIEEGLYYTWIMNIGVAMENIRKQLLLKSAVNRLNRIWMYDTLTHLYNRSGFFHFAGPMLQELRESGSEAFLLFLDLDGLKIVNDTQGHEAGDLLISMMADVVKKSITDKEIAMRYGGDEFVVMGEQGGENRMEELTEGLRRGMELWNQKNAGFRLSASIGGSCFAAAGMEDLEKLIEEADKHMYEEKRLKKMRAKQQ